VAKQADNFAFLDPERHVIHRDLIAKAACHGADVNHVQLQQILLRLGASPGLD